MAMCDSLRDMILIVSPQIQDAGLEVALTRTV